VQPLRAGAGRVKIRSGSTENLSSAGRSLERFRNLSKGARNGFISTANAFLRKTQSIFRIQSDLFDSESTFTTSQALETSSSQLGTEKPRRLVPQVSLSAILAGVVILTSAIYFFGIGRNRYQVNSSFIVRLPDAPSTTTSSLLGTTLAGPTMLGSLEDGRFLAVYLTSPEVMKRVFLQLKPEVTWARNSRDPFAGLRANANFDEQLAFFRRQVFVTPQDLTGVINLTTIGLDPKPSYKLNQLLLQEAEIFLNRVNQGISANQQKFAESEVEKARLRLDQALTAFNNFKNRFGQLDPAQASAATTSYITQLEGKLVDLKVQEASLKRQFKDPTTPEVAYISDQVREMERQIQEERDLLVAPEGKDLNRIVAEGAKLETEVTLATEALKASVTAADNSRQRTQQQIKFLVRLAEPEIPILEAYDWRWKGFLATVGGLVVIAGLSSFALGIVDRR
jgi:capsular polysaccharide transport system permease protein